MGELIIFQPYYSDHEEIAVSPCYDTSNIRIYTYISMYAILNFILTLFLVHACVGNQ